MVTQKNVKNMPIFSCICCGFETRNKTNYDKHVLTTKHLKMSKCVVSGDIKNAKKYICPKCDKVYCSRNGLWKHKTTCNISNDVNKQVDSPKVLEEILLSILNQNKELHKMIIQQNHKMLELETQIKCITNVII